MIKFVYFSYLFSVIALTIFFLTWKFNLVNTVLYTLSVLFNIISIYFLSFKRRSILKKNLWFIINGLVHLTFIFGMSYLAIMYFRLLGA